MYSGGMVQLNYHHLRVFWTAAREGGVTRASEKLHVSQPTVTTQIRALEQALGQKLFARSGRRLALTEAGRAAFRYADEIVGLGEELVDRMNGGVPGRELRLIVGVADVLPKLIAGRILEPALRLPESVRVEGIEDAPERLLAELAVFGLDVVLADAPVGPGARVRAYNHLLGECSVSVFGAPSLVAAYRRTSPALWTARLSCSRGSTRPCGSRWTTGSSERRCVHTSSASSTTAPSSRRWARPGSGCSPRRRR